MSSPPGRSFPALGRGRPGDAVLPVFSVGRRVLVSCPPGSVATVTDENGSTAVATLDEGTEVEILAWRPRGAGGPRYRVRSTREGIEGWMSSRSLRRPAEAPAATPAPSVRPRR
jgi:hypothetical protein